MSITIPPILVVIACKVALAGPPDMNAAFTHVENNEWKTENSMMICQRHEIMLYDPAEDGGRDAQGSALPPAQPLNANFANFSECAREAMMEQMHWDDG